jgi:hypothetical protein
MTDKIRITVIATGFDSAAPARPAILHGAVPTVTSKSRVVFSRPQAQADLQPSNRMVDSDNLDIPSFLRRR